MALTADYANRIIHSTASITDAAAFHAALREIEAGDEGILYPPVHTYKALPLGGGAVFPAIEFINGWTLQFPAGNFEMRGGNIKAAINPTPGCFVERTQSAAYAVTSLGAGGPTADDIASAVRANLASDLTRLLEVWGRLGLDPNKPLINGTTEIAFGDIVMALTESGGTVTATRR